MPLSVTEKEAFLAQRKRLVDDAGATIALSREANKGNPTAEAEAEANKLMDQAEAIWKQIEDDDKAEARSKATNSRLAAAEAQSRQGTGRQTQTSSARADSPHNSNIVEYGRYKIDISRDAGMTRRNSAQYQEAFSNHLRGHNNGPQAVMQLDNAESGGVLAPPKFVAELIKELNEIMVMRQICRVLPPATAREITFPRRTQRERRMQKGQVWVVPVVTGTDAKIGTATWTLHPWTGECQVNKALIQFAVLDVEQFIREEINYDRAVTQEQLFMTGTGTLEPFGFFVANASGLPTSADVATGGAFSYDNIVDFKMSLRDVYLRSKTVRVLSHRNFQKVLMKLRSTDGIPLFQPSLRVGEPDTMLGVPMVFSEFAPPGTGAGGTYANTDYVAVIGEFNEYWIYESSELSIEMHDLDTRANLKSFLYRNWFDGNFKMQEAFKRLLKS